MEKQKGECIFRNDYWMNMSNIIYKIFMEKKLVSIVVPCYNVEKYISRLIDSILNQTYNNIEVIFINDGSLDRTETIILKSKNKIQKRGMHFKYIFQHNKGLGGAINTGLKEIEGDYFCWVDPDDVLIEDSIRRRVEILEKNVDYACVTSDAYVYDSNDLDTPICKVSDWAIKNSNDDQFNLLLKRQSIFCCGCHMIRTSSFLEVNPKREIYEAKRGQNWQILLPVYYRNKRFFLNQCLYKYIIYEKSMSHNNVSKNDELKRNKEYKCIVFNTLNSMDMPYLDRILAKRVFEENNLRDAFHITMSYNDFFLCTINLFLLILKFYIKKYDFIDYIVFIRKLFEGGE